KRTKDCYIRRIVYILGSDRFLISLSYFFSAFPGSRSAFSIALNNNSAMVSYGPFSSDSIIKYKHVFINLGDGYNVETGIFTVPRSGVYSLSVTVYSSARVTLSNCVTLQVNGENVAEAIERSGQDLEDSTSVVVAVQLNAGDQLSARLLQGCSLSDDINHYNTFTGFLVTLGVCVFAQGCLGGPRTDPITSRVAFSFSLFSDENFKCYGPFSEMNKIVIYKNAFLNLGGAYNMNTGVFTVPFSGVYSLAVTIFSDAGSPGNMLAACANLQVNNKVMARAKEFNTNDQEDSATIVVAMHLKVGDMVTVTLSSGCYLCDESYYNTFSGFLLYVTE
uniref:C1q domain-containing protein n=1 Tax=Astatotilapia calliptera TaxID=8154 RepID=A0A3P8PHR6_ASTCA